MCGQFDPAGRSVLNSRDFVPRLLSRDPGHAVIGNRRRPQAPALPPLLAVLLLMAIPVAGASQHVDPWIQLFNGTDLEGWTVKIAGQELGRQLRQHLPRRGRPAEGRLRRVRDVRRHVRAPVLQEPLSPLPAARRVPLRRRAGAGRPRLGVPQQRRDAARPAAETMGRDQEFPDSIEVQLLGGGGRGQPPDRQPLHAGHPRRHGRQLDDAPLHELHARRPTTATSGSRSRSRSAATR